MCYSIQNLLWQYKHLLLRLDFGLRQQILIIVRNNNRIVGEHVYVCVALVHELRLFEADTYI